MADFDPDDISVFRDLSQTSAGDRRSLLRIQALVRGRKAGYRYVETGSFVGGTLLPHLLDPACAALVSIDPRPQASYPDMRGDDVANYEGVTTELMLSFLKQYASDDQLGKLTTIEADASAVPPERIGPCDLAFIDGEHTSAAVLSDVTSLLPALAEDALIAFHDIDLVRGGIDAALARLGQAGIPHRFFPLPDVVGVIALRASVAPAEAAFARVGEA